MKKITAGIIAHVDAGKTTLSEALLYKTGALRQLGRVDNGDAFLDSDALEKARGITIFSHEAKLQYQDLELTLLDTPGHVDFASATEQVLSVLDCAVLVVSATDGIPGYTRTLWRLLARYQVPAFIFVNKMDVPGADQAQVLDQLQGAFGDGCIAFTDLNQDRQETIALQDDAALDEFSTTGQLADATIQRLIAARKVTPVYFGSGLKLQGIDDLLAGLERWTQPLQPTADFGARVFKISYDDKGERLTWLRVTGGSLKPKQVLLGEQKANQLRLYNGEKFSVVQEVSAGQVCAIPGLQDTHPGLGLGVEPDAKPPVMQPVMTYKLAPQAEDPRACLTALRQLEDEDPALKVSWSERLQELRVSIMGKVQLEILTQLLAQRFDLHVAFGTGSILYQETITQAVEGVGHFEPLRHYAEVHLLLQPAPRGSGMTYASDLPVEALSKNWQHLVLANLTAKQHIGVLTGSPLTDVKITLVGGRGSNVHTVGGDFREATWRAVRQGLMELKQTGGDLLLEPWYSFRLVVAQDQVGRAMADVDRMAGTVDPPTVPDRNGTVTLTGFAPVAAMQDYGQTVSTYTHGQGQLELLVAGYRPCHNAADVIKDIGYTEIGDTANLPGSVFCAHGAGYPVAWEDVPAAAHVPYRYTQAELAAMTGKKD